MNTATAHAFGASESALVGIYEISKLLASPDRLERTLAGVRVLLSSLLDMRHGLIALLGKQGEPEVVVGSGWCETNAKKYFDRLPERAVGQIIATKMPLVIENVVTSPLFEGSDLSEWGPPDRSALFSHRRSDQGWRRRCRHIDGRSRVQRSAIGSIRP